MNVGHIQAPRRRQRKRTSQARVRVSQSAPDAVHVGKAVLALRSTGDRSEISSALPDRGAAPEIPVRLLTGAGAEIPVRLTTKGNAEMATEMAAAAADGGRGRPNT